MEEYDSGRLPGGGCRVGDAHRQDWKDGEYRHAACVFDGLVFICGVAVYFAGSATAVPDAGDLLWRTAADCAGAWRGVQPDDDDQPGKGELDSAGCLACHWDGGVFSVFD